MEDSGRILLLASVYLPYDDGSRMPTRRMQDLVEYAVREGTDLILGCGANTHNMVWGTMNMNLRGETLLDYIISNNRILINVGFKPTFVNRDRKEAINLCNNLMMNRIYN